ncbi:MAG: polysaccharide pyruvyl transferase family protein [Propioniciclava sp.]
MFRILLLTNRDSDNVGDQIIEATAISLIKGVMENVDLRSDSYSISSRAAGIISKKYLRTRDPELLAGARQAISEADIIIFGGAPLFNYSYQNFYLRTIATLELAEEYGVPVLFSSIGVEPFDESNPKCLQLKEALALPCVRQITTRDDMASLERYVEGTKTPVGHVSDPAVFADIVFRRKPSAPPRGWRTYIPARVKAPARRLLQRLKSRGASAPTPTEPTPSAPIIGLVVTRAGIFADNGIEFSEDDQRAFWLDVRRILLERGYQVRFFTTGHFSDEVFLDTLVKSEGIPASQAAVVINSPEGLIGQLKACSGVIAYRLHASITSFAFGIPSIGLSWNFKVPYFYAAVGHSDRALGPDEWHAERVVAALEDAMQHGVAKDEHFMMTVYEALFHGIKDVVAPECTRAPFTYADLQDRLPRYPGTSAKQYQEKARRKLRRTYESYQKYSEFYLARAGKEG